MTEPYAFVTLAAWLAVTREAVREPLRAMRRLLAAMERRREVRHLAELDDRILTDIGLSRSDFDKALSEPMFYSPSILLLRSGERPGRVEIRDPNPTTLRPAVPTRRLVSRAWD